MGDISVRIRQVDADLNYIDNQGVRPQVFNEDFTRNILPLQAVRVAIEDVSASETAPRLEMEGFALIPHRGTIEDLTGPKPSFERYRAELKDLLETLIDADHVEMANASPIRRSVPAQDANLNNGFPVPIVHGDITVAGVAHMIPWAYGPPPIRPIKRMALFNFWRLLSKGPTDTPLAICDARTFAKEDIVAGDSHFLTDGFTFEAVFVRPNPAHRWCYYSRMSSDDVLIFKQYDSDPIFPVQVPHSAFIDSSCPPDPASRISVESRAVAYWFAD
ncbi:CmcJ/NvfI family oxidoreductase [Paraburkholderia sediminicola]|uniref:CmcJ/NvfI family oxidoreductase n=1 Tax=Paraburkholderia sediminicola TaxID=458836 RepID=UPI0038B8DB32